MTITMYKGDLPKNLDFGDSVAIDTETLGSVSYTHLTLPTTPYV